MTTVPLTEHAKHPESWYRDLLAAQVGGVIEVHLPFGFADVMTDSTVFEVEPVVHWRDGVRQVLAYAGQCDRRAALAVYGKPSMAQPIWQALQELPAPGIELWWLVGDEFTLIADSESASGLAPPELVVIPASPCLGRRPRPTLVQATASDSDTRHITIPEIAARYGRTIATVRAKWTTDPAWPAATGRRGRWLEYDPDAVELAVQAIATRAPLGDGPDDLLTVIQAAGYAGVAASTIRADMSRGRWPQPDDDADGVKRWRRSTIAAAMDQRRSYRRR